MASNLRRNTLPAMVVALLVAAADLAAAAGPTAVAAAPTKAAVSSDTALPAAAPPKASAPRLRSRGRATGDARKCLELDRNPAIIRCAEPYR